MISRLYQENRGFLCSFLLSSFSFECNISNQVVDSFEQLKRRIVSLKLTEDTYSDLKNELIKDEEIAEAIWKIKSQKNTSHADSDKSND